MPYDADAPVEVIARDRLIRLRDFLADLPDERFDFGSYSFHRDNLLRRYTDCGTPACIGGWATRLFGVRVSHSHGEHLGMPPNEALELMNPSDLWERHRLTHARVSPRMAVAVLDHYLATGKVDWAVVA